MTADDLETAGDGDPRGLRIPVTARGQTIGAIRAYKPEDGEGWTVEERVLIEVLVEQLGLALEGARLYGDTQRRAVREQVTAEVTGRLRETLDMDVVLRTAVQEIREALGLHDVTIQMEVLGQG